MPELSAVRMVQRLLGTQPTGRLVLAAALALLALSPAAAQVIGNPLRPAGTDNPPCVLDRCLGGSPSRASPPSEPETPEPTTAPAGPAATAPGAFDFYVLALSWSPGFCDTGGASRARRQCAEGADLGFVVHGLWPQNRQGYPSDCGDGSRQVPRAALDAVRGLYPDEGLARHEWLTHGTCTGLGPAEYFAQVRRARDRVAVPPSLAAPGEPLTLAPLDVVRAFSASNPGLRADMVAVACRQGELEEVRLCLTKDLRGFTSCPEVARGACRTRSIEVLPLR